MIRKFLEDLEFDIRVTGTLLPSSWDKKGVAQGVLLEVEEDEEYHILMDERGQSLIPDLKSIVTIEGAYWTDDWGKMWLKVDSFQIVRGSSDVKKFQGWRFL